MARGRRGRVATVLLAALAVPLAVVPPAAAQTSDGQVEVVRREIPSPAARAALAEQRRARAAAQAYPAVSDVVRRSFAISGVPRSLTLVRPAGPPRAVLVMLHAQNNTADSVVQDYGLQPLVASGVLLVVPSGLAGSWNVGGTCCGYSGVQGVDDLSMLVEAVRIGSEYAPATAPRVLAGYSTGGILVGRAVCNGASARAGIDAAVVVAGTLPGACTSPAPPRLLVDLHGERDANIRMYHDTYRPEWGVTLPASAPAMARLRARAGCAAPSVTTAGTTRTLVALCPRGVVRQVVRTTVGHSYTGLGTPAVLRSVVDALPPRG